MTEIPSDDEHDIADSESKVHELEQEVAALKAELQEKK